MPDTWELGSAPVKYRADVELPSLANHETYVPI